MNLLGKENQLTDDQIKNLFNNLSKMCGHEEKAKLMTNKQLKDFIIESNVYGNCNIYSLEIACLEEALERLSPTREEEMTFAE